MDAQAKEKWLSFSLIQKAMNLKRERESKLVLLRDVVEVSVRREESL